QSVRLVFLLLTYVILLSLLLVLLLFFIFLFAFLYLTLNAFVPLRFFINAIAVFTSVFRYNRLHKFVCAFGFFLVLWVTVKQRYELHIILVFFFECLCFFFFEFTN